MKNEMDGDVNDGQMITASDEKDGANQGSDYGK